MRNYVNQYSYHKSRLQCERYLKANLIHYMRLIETDNFVNLYYGRPSSAGWDNSWKWTDELFNTFNKFSKYEEQQGYTWSPIEVDTVFQLLSVNDINLNQEYLDATIAISMQWKDDRLAWDQNLYGRTQLIR